jgi:hypothetical protein
MSPRLRYAVGGGGIRFTTPVVADVPVLLLTALIVDRIVSARQLKKKSQVIAAQAAVVVAQSQCAAKAFSAIVA